MAKRSMYSVKCDHEGCNEYARYEAPTRVELRRGWNSYKTSYKCTRHCEPHELLTPTNVERSIELECVAGEGRISSHKFWKQRGKSKPDSGFLYGPGFKMFAEDFPLGTVITVTAKVMMTEST